MATAIDRLGRRVGRLARMAVDLQSLAVDLATELAIMRRVLEDHASGRVDVVAELALRRAADARRLADKRAAATGASTLEMRVSRLGRALVRIDGSEWIRLTRGDGRLLQILATAPAGADGFPQWRTYDEIQTTIAEKTGARPTRRAVIESVYRVRRALKGSDVNEYLLQVDRGSGRLRVLVRSRGQDRRPCPTPFKARTPNLTRAAAAAGS